MIFHKKQITFRISLHISNLFMLSKQMDSHPTMSYSSSSSSTVDSATTTRSYSTLTPSNHLQIKLAKDKYLSWITAILPYINGRIILEAAILTFVAVVSLTLYTFWAVKRGKDFSFLGPFLFASLLVLIVLGLIQIFIPLGKISEMIYSGLSSLIFCGYLVYDTYNMIKRDSYDDYIWAAVSLYLDVVNIFISLLNVLDAANS